MRIRIKGAATFALVATAVFSSTTPFARAQFKSTSERLAEVFWSSSEDGTLYENIVTLSDSTKSTSTAMTFNQNGTCKFGEDHLGRWILRGTDLVIMDGSKQLIFPVMTLRKSSEKASLKGRDSASDSRELVLLLETSGVSTSKAIAEASTDADEDSSYFGDSTNSH